MEIKKIGLLQIILGLSNILIWIQIFIKIIDGWFLKIFLKDIFQYKKNIIKNTNFKQLKLVETF